MSSEPTPGRRLWRALTSVRARAVLSLGVFLGFGAVGTTAYWSDQATLEVQSIRSGTLDLQLGPNGTTWFTRADMPEPDRNLWTFAVIELADVAPGESVAMDMWFKNGGTTPLTFTGTAKTTTNALSPKLEITTRVGATAVNTGSRQGVNRAGTCTGGSTNWWTNLPLSMTPVDVTPDNSPQLLAAGESLRACMLVTFRADAPTTMQGASTVIEATFNAKQLGAP